MKRFLIATSMMGALLAFAAGVTAQVSTEVALRSAIERETVKGDLKGAIDQYKKLAQGKDRAMASKALVRIGQCYEKLGDAEARKVYERAVRDFSDQTEAVAIARARLAAMEKTATPGAAASRLVVGLPASPSTWHIHGLSPDGQYLLLDGKGGLELRDLTTGQIRLVMKGEVFSAKFSRDGRQIAVARFSGVSEIWTTSLDDASERIIWHAEKGSNWHARPLGWLPDGRRLLVYAQQSPDGAPSAGEAMVVSVLMDDGTASTLWKGQPLAGEPELSPDGRFVLYQKRAQRDPAHDEIRLLSLEDRSESVVFRESGTVEEALWTPGGDGIVYLSDRRQPGKARDLWMLRVSDGQLKGRPELVKGNMEAAWPIGPISRDGTYYYNHKISMTEVFTTEFDSLSGTAIGQPVVDSRGDLPMFSRDGRWAASLTETAKLRMRSLETGEERDVPTELMPTGNAAIFPDGRSVLVSTWHKKDGWGLHRLDAATGTSTLLKAGRFIGDVAVSPDAKNIYYVQYQRQDGLTRLLTMDIETGKERELLKSEGEGPNYTLFYKLSPDGRHIAISRPDRSTWVLELVPVDGGVKRELRRAEVKEWLNIESWSPDGRHLFFIYTADAPGRPRKLLRIPVAGGPVQDTGILGVGGKLTIHPDGRRIYYVVRQARNEIWALENSLPKKAK